MQDNEIYAQIKALVDEEHALGGATGPTEDKRDRRRQIEEQLDQCWDLLRQRQALREFDQDPAQARLRPAQEVEGYLQ